MCCMQECARYLETIKIYETKAPDAIQGRTEEDYLSRFTAAVTTVRGVNRTDVLTLGRAFGSLAGTMQVCTSRSGHGARLECMQPDAGMQRLSLTCAGFVRGDVDMSRDWANKSSPLA